MKRALGAALLGLLLSGCAPSAAVRLGQAMGVTLYLPTALPAGLHFSQARKVGPRMAYVVYTAQKASLAIFESPETIAPPPGAAAANGGLEAVIVQRGQTVRTLLVQLPHAYCELVATGLASKDLKTIEKSLQEYAP